MRPSYAHLVTHIASLREPAEQMAMMKAGHLIRAFSGGSEHLSLWYSAYTEPISRAFIPAVTQKTSADPSWDNTEQRGFISSTAIANVVLQQHIGRNIGRLFQSKPTLRRNSSLAGCLQKPWTRTGLR